MKKFKRKGFRPYMDDRGGSGSFRMPRKLKKWWRQQIVANLHSKYGKTIKWDLWWQPRVGWAVKVTGYPGRNKFQPKVGICQPKNS